LVGFAFINDTDLCIFGPQVNDQNVQEEMQNSVNQWEGLLRTTGGALVPTKYFWYLIDFQYMNNKWTYVTKSQHPGQLTIKDDQQHRVTIPQLKMNKARCTLGVRLAPDGNWETELQYLLSVTSDWKAQMAAA